MTNCNQAALPSMSKCKFVCLLFRARFVFLSPQMIQSSGHTTDTLSLQNGVVEAANRRAGGIWGDIY